MSDAQQEPSMEEILASIRKIISEDGEEGDAKPAEEPAEEAPVPEPEPEPELESGAFGDEEDEPLDLVEEEEEPLELDEEEEEEPLELDEEEEPVEIEFADAEEEEYEPPPPPPPRPPSVVEQPKGDDRIVSEPTEAAAAAAFLQLEQSIRMGHAGETLEDVVKGLLRPMLRSWLDENLPGMVERLVRAEIEKMAGGARRRGDEND